MTNTNALSKEQAKLRKKTRFRKEYLNNWQLYLMLLPVIWLLIFCYFPMAGLQIAFKDFKIRQGIWGSEWIGFANFERFFESYQFVRVLKNTLTVSFYSLIASFPLPIVLALSLNVVRRAAYKKFVQMVTYILHFISVIVIVGILLQMFNSRIGLYGSAYQALTGQQAPDILSKASAFPHMYVWSGVWQEVGWGSIICRPCPLLIPRCTKRPLSTGLPASNRCLCWICQPSSQRQPSC